MENSKKFVKYISDSISNMSSMLYDSSSEIHEANSISDDIEMSNIDTLTSQDWSKNNVCDETIIIKKSEYDKVLNELSFSRMQNNNYKIKEREYVRMKNDYDRTLSFLLENNQITNIIPPDIVENNMSIINDNDINRLRATECRLKSHIKALKKDLFDSEQRADAFKCIAQKDIERRNFTS